MCMEINVGWYLGRPSAGGDLWEDWPKTMFLGGPTIGVAP